MLPKKKKVGERSRGPVYLYFYTLLSPSVLSLSYHLEKKCRPSENGNCAGLGQTASGLWRMGFSSCFRISLTGLQVKRQLLSLSYHELVPITMQIVAVSMCVWVVRRRDEKMSGDTYKKVILERGSEGILWVCQRVTPFLKRGVQKSSKQEGLETWGDNYISNCIQYCIGVTIITITPIYSCGYIYKYIYTLRGRREQVECILCMINGTTTQWGNQKGVHIGWL